jgi:transcriptional regulator
VVPTWNYTAVHFTGRAEVHDDPEWVRDAVTRLTSLHDQGREQPWAVGDAPRRYLEGQLRAIVGVELVTENVEGKGQAEPEPLCR